MNLTPNFLDMTKYRFSGAVLPDNQLQFRVGSDATVMRKLHENFQWWEGTQTSSAAPNTVTIAFNVEELPWDYSGWTSHKSISDIHHYFVAVVWEKVTEGNEIIAALVFSAPFKVHSRSKRGADEIGEIEERELKMLKFRDSLSLPSHDPAPADASSGIRSLVRRVSSHVQGFFNDLLGASAPYSGSATPRDIAERTMLTLNRLFMALTETERFSHERLHQRLQYVEQILCENGYTKEESVKVCKDLTKLRAAFGSVLVESKFEAQLNEIWMGLETDQNLQKRLDDEVYCDIEWAPEMEFEAYDEMHGLDRSLFAKFRSVVRDIICCALERLGFVPLDFEKPMDIASHNWTFLRDPFHPPRALVADQVYLATHGTTLKDRSIYSAEQDNFTSMESHYMYARDLLVYNRIQHQAMVRQHMCANEDLESTLSKLMSVENEDVSLGSMKSFCGTWVDMEADTGRRMLQSPGVIGSLLGPFLSNLLRASLRRMKFRYISETLVIQTDMLYTLESFYTYEFDGKEHKTQFNTFLTSISNPDIIRTPFRRYIGVSFLSNPSLPPLTILLDPGIIIKPAFLQNRYHDFCKKYPSPMGYSFIRALVLRPDSPEYFSLVYFDFLIPVQADGQPDLPETLDAAFLENVVTKKPYLADISMVSYVKSLQEDLSEQIILQDML